jgi:hypothetical protein
MTPFFKISNVVLLMLVANYAAADGKPLTLGVDSAPVLQAWMNPDIGAAWGSGFKGQGVTLIVVDDFKSKSGYNGNLGSGTQLLRHGEWTLKEASMIATSATVKTQDFNSGTAVRLNSGLNVVNLSYAIYLQSGYAANQIRWSSQEKSLINDAATGAAIISKAAGNDSVAVGAANKSGNIDYLNLALKGTASAIYVGALNSNGSTIKPATLASYSNMAGNDAVVQKQFLTVGVEGSKTGLDGTSFAAPIISGYAAILGSKFTNSNSTQITNQLLNTARQDTVSNYSAAVYGRGEASLARALAPVSIK